MAPYGACEVAQSTARSNAQFEAERFRKWFRRKKKHARAMISKQKEACSSGDFEGNRSMFEQ